MSEEYIELCHCIEDGVHIIRDQHGRRIKGHQSSSVSFGCDEVTTLNIQCIEYVDGKPSFNGSRHTSKRLQALNNPEGDK